MKLIIALLLPALAAAAKGGFTPQLTVGLSNDAFNAGVMGVLEPSLKFTFAESMGEYDFEGGLDVAVEDVNPQAVPYSFWGTVRRSLQKGWNLAGRIEGASSDLSVLGLEVAASNANTAVLVTGSASNSFEKKAQVTSLQLAQKLSGLGGQWTIIPRFTFPDQKPDVTVSYGYQDTVLTVDATPDVQKLTVSQLIGDRNVITPSFDTNGKVELDYRREISAGQAVTASIKPDEYVGVKYEDGPWAAQLQAPLSGYAKFHDGVRLQVRRTLVETL